MLIRSLIPFKRIVLLSILLLLTAACFANDLSKFDKYYKIATSFLNNKPDSSIYYANQAQLIAESSDAEELVLKVLILKSKANLILGKLHNAYELCLQAQDIASRNQLFDRQAEILTLIGNMYLLSGLHSEAINFLLEAYLYVEDINNNDVKGDVSYNLGLAYFEIGEIERCQEYVRHCILQSKVSDNSIRLINSYILLSNTFNHPDSLIKYYKLTEEIIDKNPAYQYEKVVLRNNQALFYEAIGNFGQSKKLYLEAIKISETNGYQEHLANLYNNYAYLLMAENIFDSAQISLDLALNAALKIESIDLQASIYDSYSDYFEAIGNYEKALEYTDISISKRNEYREQQRAQESLFLSVVFETEQKEKELLKQENEINRSYVMLSAAAAFIISLGFILLYFRNKFKISKLRLVAFQKSKSLEVANAVIDGQDTERKRLGMDLHDGIGAQLGALKLQFDAYFGKDPNHDYISGFFNEIGKGIRDISHRMSPARLNEFGLDRTLRNLVESLNNSDQFNIDLQTNLESRLDQQKEISIYYLVFELVSNAIKHSRAKNIQVQLIHHDDIINLSVEDDGIGMNHNQNKDGHGMINIKRRVDFLSGKILIDTNENIGTSVLITIPDNHD